MRYLYITKRNHLFISSYMTTVDVGDTIVITVNDKTVIRGTIIDKRNGIKLSDWDILNSEELFKNLDISELEQEAEEFAQL